MTLKLLHFLKAEFSVGCCHVSVIQETSFVDASYPGGIQYDKHILKELSELDYIGQYR